MDEAMHVDCAHFILHDMTGLLPQVGKTEGRKKKKKESGVDFIGAGTEGIHEERTREKLFRDLRAKKKLDDKIKKYKPLSLNKRGTHKAQMTEICQAGLSLLVSQGRTTREKLSQDQGNKMDKADLCMSTPSQKDFYTVWWERLSW